MKILALIISLLISLAAGLAQDTSKTRPRVQATIYSAEWCGPCRPYIAAVSKQLPKDGWIVRYITERGHEFAHVIVTKNESEFPRHRIGSIPCTIIRDRGREVRRIYGAISPDELEDAICEIAEKGEKTNQ